MCGIFGVVGRADRELGERVARAIHHRGPDDSGVWIDKTDTPVTLVNTRLAIIDLSAAGHMPMLSEDGGLAITYNGEVYNFRELRRELRSVRALTCASGARAITAWPPATARRCLAVHPAR